MRSSGSCALPEATAEEQVRRCRSHRSIHGRGRGNYVTASPMADMGLAYAERIEAARLALSRGDRPEAERLLTDALESGERQFGAEHPSLAPVLNELSRLYIRQSDHARAEVVLERLLRITRTRGEEHPDVATALTGLGLVKRALGDDVAAEDRFREALRIREKMLPSQHMATVVTMEQLAETCAARGNVSEALALLQRALPTREAGLGSDHATVRALQSRIAALELRVSEPIVTPAEQTVAPEQPDAAAPTDVPVSLPIGRSRRKRITRYASVGVTAVALATVGLSVGSGAGVGGEHDAASIATESRSAAVSTAPSTSGAATLGTATMAAVLRHDSVHSATGTSTPIASSDKPATESATPPAPPKLRIAPRSLAAVTAKLLARTNVDSLVRASTKVGRELLTDQIGTAGGLHPSSHVDDASMRPARLIGPAPAPRFPDDLRSHWTEGEVAVRFRVDERGRIDMSSVKVLQSDHDLFTAAVRNVLPRFRFEPARSPAPESKAISDWVDYRVRFAAVAS
jgi:TonB family protein